MLRLARHLSGMIGARRLAVVLGVLASFAVVVSLATVLVMMALGFLANRANELDEERTRQTVFGALSTMRNSMVTTVRDYAVWDDAVAAVYGTPDMPWLIANMGLATEGGPLFDTVFLVDETGRTMLAYRNGAPVKADARSYGGAAFLEMHRKILRAGLEPGAELGVFLQTPDGPAVGAASAIRPVSSAVEAPAEALRTLFHHPPPDTRPHFPHCRQFPDFGPVAGGIGSFERACRAPCRSGRKDPRLPFLDAGCAG